MRAKRLADELRRLAADLARPLPRRPPRGLVPPAWQQPTETPCIERMEQLTDDLKRALAAAPA